MLTTAHCVSQEQVDRHYKVRLGTERIDDGTGVPYRIDRIVRHARYDPHSNLNDAPNAY